MTWKTDQLAEKIETEKAKLLRDIANLTMLCTIGEGEDKDSECNGQFVGMCCACMRTKQRKLVIPLRLTSYGQSQD